MYANPVDRSSGMVTYGCCFVYPVTGAIDYLLRNSYYTQISSTEELLHCNYAQLVLYSVVYPIGAICILLYARGSNWSGLNIVRAKGEPTNRASE